MKKIMWLVLTIVIVAIAPTRVYALTEDELYLMAQVVQAEAGNQCILGQRYVCDTILNRYDSSKFPDTISDVINAPNQYTKARPVPTEQVQRIVREEVEKGRLNYDVVFFQRAGFFDGTKPVTKIQDHYFSGIIYK